MRGRRPERSPQLKKRPATQWRGGGRFGSRVAVVVCLLGGRVGRALVKETFRASVFNFFLPFRPFRAFLIQRLTARLLGSLQIFSPFLPP